MSYIDILQSTSTFCACMIPFVFLIKKPPGVCRSRPLASQRNRLHGAGRGDQACGSYQGFPESEDFSICLKSQIRANAQSRFTDRGAIFKIAATSSTENPPK